MPQGVSQTWEALLADLHTMFDGQNDTLVCAGDPGDYQPSLIVALMGLRAPITQPTAGTNRSRDKRIEIDIVISSYIAGGPEAQPPANDAAWTTSDTIETFYRTGDNARMRGACYNAFLEVTNMTPIVSWDAVEGLDDPIPAGRIAQIDAVLRAWIRI